MSCPLIVQYISKVSIFRKKNRFSQDQNYCSLIGRSQEVKCLIIMLHTTVEKTDFQSNDETDFN
jgi:hypothetical protein